MNNFLTIAPPGKARWYLIAYESLPVLNHIIIHNSCGMLLKSQNGGSAETYKIDLARSKAVIRFMIPKSKPYHYV